MKKSRRAFAIVLSLSLVTVTFLFLNARNSGTMQDDHLRGLLEKGARYKYDPSWYKTHPILRGDIVLYRYSSNQKPVLKIVQAVSGDKFHLVKAAKLSNWNIEINGSLLQENCVAASERDTCPLYFFGGSKPPTLSLYEKSHRGILGEDEVILFSSVSPGFQDSGVFGLINVGDILGRVRAEN